MHLFVMINQEDFNSDVSFKDMTLETFHEYNTEVYTFDKILKEHFEFDKLEELVRSDLCSTLFFSLINA